MKHYPINEIFLSLQGEGYYVGTASIFIRFSGCNLACDFCDTEHGNPKVLMTLDEIMAAISTFKAIHVVLTGGEPSLFVDEDLISKLHSAGKFVAIETNGTRPLPKGIDWVTLSPKGGIKGGAKPKLCECDELKVVYTGQNLNVYDDIQARHRFLQPCDSGDAARNAENIKQTISFCMEHPQWRLSLQTHKLIGIR